MNLLPARISDASSLIGAVLGKSAIKRGPAFWLSTGAEAVFTKLTKATVQGRATFRSADSFFTKLSKSAVERGVATLSVSAALSDGRKHHQKSETDFSHFESFINKRRLLTSAASSSK